MLIFRKKWGDSEFAIWKAEESEAFFSAQLPLSTYEKADLERHQHPQRRKEWLAGRFLLHLLTRAQQRYPLAKDLYSKPFFVENTDLHCSLSHSQGIVGALLSPVKCGCDIQVVVDKMARIAPKFMRPDEQQHAEAAANNSRLLVEHVYWTAKEALYKAYGLKELDFKNNLYLEQFDWQTAQPILAKAHIKKNAEEESYQLRIGYLDTEEAPPLLWTIAEKERL